MITVPNFQVNREIIEHWIYRMEKAMDWFASAMGATGFTERNRNINLTHLVEVFDDWPNDTAKECPYFLAAHHHKNIAIGLIGAVLIESYYFRDVGEVIGVELENCLTKLHQAKELHIDLQNSINNLNE